MAPLYIAGPSMLPRRVIATAAAVSTLAAASTKGNPALAKAGNDILHNFERYIAHHGRAYESTEEYLKRMSLFQMRVAEIEKHNSNPGRLWHAAVNKLTDRTEAELERLRGYRRIAKAGGGQDAGGGRGPVGSFLGQSARTFDIQDLPRDFNYLHLKAMQDVHDQGACGSCWAFATTTVLRAHSELYQQDRTFSVQQIVDCTPNPQQCGGSGGCNGATAELAFQYLSEVDLHDENTFPYRGSSNGQCPSASKTEFAQVQPSFLDALKKSLHLSSSTGAAGEHVPAPASSNRGGAKIGMRSWRKLPENKVQPLLLALYEQGPVAVSVFANSQWNLYSSGIMDVCEKDAIINHAVTLIGYGESSEGVKYWNIQNSWGPEWGEQGHVRLLRRNDAEENDYCGVDDKPELGTGCQGGPAKVTVCGQCGILYDSVVPSFDLSPDGLLSRSPKLNSIVNATRRSSSSFAM